MPRNFDRVMATVCESIVPHCLKSTGDKRERFCAACRAEMIRRMEASRYLVDVDELEQKPREDRRGQRCQSRR